LGDVKGGSAVNIGVFFTKSALHHPDRLALADRDYELTYRQADERINSLAHALTHLGIRRGDCVAIIQHNGPQYIESLFATFKIGACAVPINFRLHLTEFEYILNHSETRALIIGSEFCEAIGSIRDKIAVEHIICVSRPLEGMLDYEELISHSPSQEACVEVAPDELAWLFYTSGTTGKPKGAMLTHRNLLAMTMNVFADLASLGPEDSVLHAAPLSHGSGLYALPSIAKGSANVILREFDPEQFCRTIEERQITHIMFLVPTQLIMLLQSPFLDRYDLSSLRYLIYGGSPMYVENLKQAVRRLGLILVQLYGQGESPMTISYLRKEEHVINGTAAQEQRLASAGLPRTDVELKIVDDAGKELPFGQIGEIVVKGEVVMRGYWKNEEATAETLRNGWLHTGDLGYLDERGYLFIADRKKDFILSGGANIYPREVEEVILRHPAVSEVAVIGVPDPLWGESVKAVVVLKENTKSSESEIIAFCKAHVASYKKPKSVEFVETLPKSAYGKVLKRELREKYPA
jgi:acyl-CoA synthetase (AMP-forming)/AMP-acid ligase II